MPRFFTGWLPGRLHTERMGRCVRRRIEDRRSGPPDANQRVRQPGYWRHALSSGVVIPAAALVLGARHSSSSSSCRRGESPPSADEMSKQRVRAPPLPPPPQPQQHQQPSPATSSSAGGGGKSRLHRAVCAAAPPSWAACWPNCRQIRASQPAKRPISTPPTSPKMNDADERHSRRRACRGRAMTKIPGFGGSMADLDADRILSIEAGRCARRRLFRVGAKPLRNVANTPAADALRLCPGGTGPSWPLPAPGRLELSDLPVESPALYKRPSSGSPMAAGVPRSSATDWPAARRATSCCLDSPSERRSLASRCLNDSAIGLWAQLVRKEAAPTCVRQIRLPAAADVDHVVAAASSKSRRLPRPPPPTFGSSAELTEAAPAAAADLPLVELDICDLMRHPFFLRPPRRRRLRGLASPTVAGGRRRFVGTLSPAGFRPAALACFQLRRAGVTRGANPLFQRHQGLAGQAHYASLFAEACDRWRPTLTGHNNLYSARPPAPSTARRISHRAPLTKPASISVGARVTALRFQRFTAIDSPLATAKATCPSLWRPAGGGGAESDKPYRVWRGTRALFRPAIRRLFNSVCTGGTGAEYRGERALWDTLFPVEKSVVAARFFRSGSAGRLHFAAYAPQRQLLLAGTAKRSACPARPCARRPLARFQVLASLECAFLPNRSL
uniref:Protein kinase domain-containing protein n=1 Tax=Macrostomum lignano TaxID=282301 RepID=A0A1I8JQ76_9PLAT